MDALNIYSQTNFLLYTFIKQRTSASARCKLPRGYPNCFINNTDCYDNNFKTPSAKQEEDHNLNYLERNWPVPGDGFLNDEVKILSAKVGDIRPVIAEQASIGRVDWLAKEPHETIREYRLFKRE